MEGFLQQANSGLREKTLKATELEEKLQQTEADLAAKRDEIAGLEEQLSGGWFSLSGIAMDKDVL